MDAMADCRMVYFRKGPDRLKKHSHVGEKGNEDSEVIASWITFPPPYHSSSGNRPGAQDFNEGNKEGHHGDLPHVRQEMPLVDFLNRRLFSSSLRKSWTTLIPEKFSWK